MGFKFYLKSLDKPGKKTKSVETKIKELRRSKTRSHDINSLKKHHKKISNDQNKDNINNDRPFLSA